MGEATGFLKYDRSGPQRRVGLEYVSRSGDNNSPPSRKAIPAQLLPAGPSQGHHSRPKGRASSQVARSWARPEAIGCRGRG